MTAERIYLDHAATSWPKPDAVLDAMDQFARSCGAAAGRGIYRSAGESNSIISQLRAAIATHIGAEEAGTVSLHASGTLALNSAIHGVLQKGDHVVATAAEHNSVLRPLFALQQRERISLDVVDVDANGYVDVGQLMQAVSPETKLVAVTHASNVTGAVQPVEQLADALKEHRALLLCDAAQTFGYLPIDVRCGIDLLAAPGHKGALGPLGTAFLYAGKAVQSDLTPLIQGGTGTRSESLEMPDDYPASFEAGNLNVPACAGLLAALRQTRDYRGQYERLMVLSSRLRDGLLDLPGVTLLGQPGPLPIASLKVEGISVIDLATILDVEFGIETRAGLHCAALIHRCIGSDPDGTLRISCGIDTSDDEVEAVVDALRSIVAELVVDD